MNDETSLPLAEGQSEDERDVSSAPMTRDSFEQWMSDVTNWGRWGPGDEFGTLNLITSSKRLQAASLIKEGISISLQRDVTILPEYSDHIDFEMTGHVFPQDHPDCQGETWTFNYHGLAQTHIDSLAHMFYKGQMYNGFPLSGVPSEHLGVEHMKQGIVTRGVLIDIPRLRGVPFLDPGTVVHCEELDAWLDSVGLEAGPGDAIFIRTGRWAYREACGPAPEPGLNLSGLDLSCTKWLRQHDVAVLGCDFPNELCNSKVAQHWLNHAPFHILTIAAMGLPLIDSCYLEAVAEQAARSNRWEFFFMAAPISVPGATGSPINPLAMF